MFVEFGHASWIIKQARNGAYWAINLRTGDFIREHSLDAIRARLNNSN